MIETLTNRYYQFEFNLSNSSWKIAAHAAPNKLIEGAKLGWHIHSSKRKRLSATHWRWYEVERPENIPSPHGPLQQIKLRSYPDQHGVATNITFALPQQYPLFLWKLQVENLGATPVYIERLDSLIIKPPSSRLQLGRNIDINSPKNSLAFFSNGWQSWSYCGAYQANAKPVRSRLGPFQKPMMINQGTPDIKNRGRFSSDMFAIIGDTVQRSAWLIGYLSQQLQFGSIEADIRDCEPSIRMWANGDGVLLEAGKQMSTDWACLCSLDVDDPDPLGDYLDGVARQHKLDQSMLMDENENSKGISNSSIPVGWCSWYHYFQGVTEHDIRTNLSTALAFRTTIPLELIQIDDGFEAQVGDWFSFSPRFPDGVKGLAEEIRAQDMQPGLWLAPFILHRGSKLAQEHPDWLLRGRFGRPVNAGFIWDTFTTALDLSRPDALDYAASTVATAAHEWGFSYLKLDFLYAGALQGRRWNKTLTRAQILRQALNELRNRAGDKATLVGCGCPLGSAIGLVDVMRIGPDVAPQWTPSYLNNQFILRSEPNMPSARNALQNTITRAFMHKRWWVNDPDCLLLSEATDLTPAEVQTLATIIAMSGGALLLSDDLKSLSPERKRFAEVILPVIGVPPRVLDWFDTASPQCLRIDLENCTGAWHLLTMVNWQDTAQDMLFTPQEFGLENSKMYMLADFWSTHQYLSDRKGITFPGVEPHGVIVLAARPLLEGVPQFTGSNLHLSQGLEIPSWQWDGTRLQFEITRPGESAGHVTIKLHMAPKRALINGRDNDWEKSQAECYRFPVHFNQSCEVEIYC